MNLTSKTIVFFGSGPVAAQSLALLQSHAAIEAIVTKPSTVAEMSAVAPSIPLYTARNRQELDALLEQRQFTSHLGIVIDFGVIISRQSINYFELGILNSHFSLLPEWRGADPITYSLLSGQSTTGVSLMLIDESLDTGKLLATAPCTINSTDTNQSLTTKLIGISDELLGKSLDAYFDGTLIPYPQPQTVTTYSRMLTKQDGILDPDRTATELERQVRAFAGWPGSRLYYQNVWLTVVDAQVSTVSVERGTLAIHGKQLYLGCKNGSLAITGLQPAGKKKMDAAAFINGYAHSLGLKTIQP